MISCTCICMYLQHYMTKQSTHQSIKQLLVSKLLSCHRHSSRIQPQSRAITWPWPSRSCHWWWRKRCLHASSQPMPQNWTFGEKKTGKVDSFPMKSLQPPHKIEVWQGPIVFWFFPGKPSGSGTQTSSLGKRTSSRRRWSQLGSSPQQHQVRIKLTQNMK